LPSTDGPNATVRRAITQVQLARGTPTGLVVNPVALEPLELETDEQGRYLVTYSVTADGRTTSWRVPVVATDAMQESQFLIGDFVRAARLHGCCQISPDVPQRGLNEFAPPFSTGYKPRKIRTENPHYPITGSGERD
jgi:hypothetical protein